ncbi:HI0074 family nucleotidyltransferase substrate-binding subunit [uncultured Dialister sp.]|jgi:nucleotidyltransferase substrate binding protein (TIGR01987 family)|uniref:HI0074 family nucleotidyltransferase substrate-binding subunit n=1 Tax=uncultured Dialister sp. TaxID=278064 RepID=UPI002610356E|nr:HI0074 family nucleotidyltransferase substrate-binding subunit [uncultured Dialister sp.]
MVRFEIFCKTLKNLEEITRRHPPYDVVVTAGLCSLFTQCFEQSWQAMKECLSWMGKREADTASPRQIVKLSHEAGLIQDESGWMKAMEERKLEIYTFNREVADTMINDTRSLFLPLFRELRRKLERRYGM